VGATFDESLDGIIRVSVVATGVDINAANNVRPTGTSHALLPTHASASNARCTPRRSRLCAPPEFAIDFVTGCLVVQRGIVAHRLGPLRRSKRIWEIISSPPVRPRSGERPVHALQLGELRFMGAPRPLELLAVALQKQQAEFEAWAVEREKIREAHRRIDASRAELNAARNEAQAAAEKLGDLRIERAPRVPEEKSPQ
jgi:hypothetical protein